MKYFTFIWLCLSQATCEAFTLPAASFATKKLITRRQSDLMAKNADEKNDYDYEDNLSRRTNINQFLTQRTFQTFIHLLKQFRDPHTGTWIEHFLGSKNLLEFHGTGAICMNKFPKWDSAMKEMIDRDPEVIIIEIEAYNAARGLSKNNPFREKENRVHEIEIDIDPASLVNRMLSVRQKISTEFVQDFDLLIAANKQILTSYNQRCLDARQDEECSKKQNGKAVKDGTNEKEAEEQYKHSMEPLQKDGSMSGDFNFGQRTIQTFERASVYMLNNHPNFINPESTLLRSTSFDLLFLLSTQEAIHRLLQSYKETGEEKEATFAWLLEYYNNSLEKYFDGDQSFGRADDFLDDMLLTPPSLKEIDGNLVFIDPLSIVEDIIEIREEVAEEWKLLISLTSHDQESLRQAVFVKQMAKWGHKVEETGISDKNSEEVEDEKEEEEEEEEKIKCEEEKDVVELFGEFE